MTTLGPYELDTIVCGDCLGVMAQMPGNCIDTIITDPPYGLEFMGKDWDHSVPGARYWKAALRVAKPGAMLLAFGGTRTHHRLMCAIEDAGWEIRDCMMWLYGSGFPKSHDISKAIDKAAGAERKVIGHHRATIPQISPRPNFGERFGDEGNNNAITAPTTKAARLWDGWGTALKPAWEPIIVAMKPREGTFAENALRWGVAGLWIDGGRVAGAPPKVTGRGIRNESWRGMEGRDDIETEMIQWKQPSGRWPANLILSHSEGCRQVGTKRVKGASGNVSGNEASHTGDENAACYGEYGRVPFRCYADPDGLETVAAWDCVPDCAVRMLGEQSGNMQTHSVGKALQRQQYAKPSPSGYGGYTDYVYHAEFTETGTAARFFYCAKASRSERTCNGEIENNHPTVKPLAVVEYLVKLTMMPTGGVVFDPFLGSGTTAVAAKKLGRHFFGCDISEEYIAMANKRLARIDGIQLPLLPR